MYCLVLNHGGRSHLYMCGSIVLFAMLKSSEIVVACKYILQ